MQIAAKGVYPEGCARRRDVGGHEMTTRVDKPWKDEAARVLDQAMGLGSGYGESAQTVGGFDHH